MPATLTAIHSVLQLIFDATSQYYTATRGGTYYEEYSGLERLPSGDRPFGTAK